MGLSALRFTTSGVYELTSSGTWAAIAGWLGVLLALLALYSALAFELEDQRKRTVLPVLRRGAGAEAMRGSAAEQVAGVRHEAGVRAQL